MGLGHLWLQMGSCGPGCPGISRAGLNTERLWGWPLSRTPAPSPTSWYLQQLTDLSFFHVKTGCQDPQGPAAVPIPPLTQLFPLRSPPALLQPLEPHWSLTTFHRPPPGLPLDASIPWASLLKIHPPQTPLPCFIHSIYHHLINTDILCPSPHCFLNLGGGSSFTPESSTWQGLHIAGTPVLDWWLGWGRKGFPRSEMLSWGPGSCAPGPRAHPGTQGLRGEVSCWFIFHGGSGWWRWLWPRRRGALPRLVSALGVTPLQRFPVEAEDVL